MSPEYHPIIVYKYYEVFYFLFFILEKNQYCEVDFTNKLRSNLYYIIFKLINIYDKKMYIDEQNE